MNKIHVLSIKQHFYCHFINNIFKKITLNILTSTNKTAGKKYKKVIWKQKVNYL